MNIDFQSTTSYQKPFLTKIYFSNIFIFWHLHIHTILTKEIHIKKKVDFKSNTHFIKSVIIFTSLKCHTWQNGVWRFLVLKYIKTLVHTNLIFWFLVLVRFSFIYILNFLIRPNTKDIPSPLSMFKIFKI